MTSHNSSNATSPSPSQLPVLITSDHGGFDLKAEIIEMLRNMGYSPIDLAPVLDPADDYPRIAEELADTIDTYIDARGIAICTTGQGVCMALNRFDHVRAGQPLDLRTAQALRAHNDANVLCLAQNYEYPELGEILSIFLTTAPSQEKRHIRRRAQLDNLGSSRSNS